MLRHPLRLAVAVPLAVSGLAACGAGPGPTAAPEPPPAVAAAPAVAGPAAPGPTAAAAAAPEPPATGLGEGLVVWESRRSGMWRIWSRKLDGSGLRQLTPDEPGHDHCCPHLSPDGSRLVYLSRPGPMRYSAESTGALRLIGVDGANDRVVAARARAYTSGDRAAVWRSASELTHIDGDGATVLLDVDSGQGRRLVAPQAGAQWLLDPTLRFAVDAPVFAPYDAERQAVRGARRFGGCEPYFSFDGRFGFWVAGAGGPVDRIDLQSREVGSILERGDERLDPEQGYVYFPMLARSGLALAFGASDGDHDHAKANYDVFVIETDPRTLEPVGAAVRFTDHPGSDRYPDVWVAPLDLDRHFGEAPHRVVLGSDLTGSGWEWDFGDGTRARNGGEHVYRRPGSYTVLASKDGRVLRGSVRVEPARPPRVKRTELRGERTVVVSFDEPVDLDAVRVELAGGGAGIAGFAPGPDGRSLAIELAAAPAAALQLVVDGVRDRAFRPNPMAATRLEVEPPSWPFRRHDLVLVWQTADAPNQLLDPASGEAVSEGLKAGGRAWLDHDQAMVLRGGMFVAPEEAWERVATGCRTANAVTLELTLEPASLDRKGFAKVVAIGNGGREPSLVLGQDGDRLQLRIRTERGAPAPLEVARLDGRGPHHLVVSYRPGRLRSFLDGRPVVDTDHVQGDFYHWRKMPVTFGDEWGRARHQWHGTLEGVAIYRRALEAEEAAEAARRYAALRARRAPVARLEVEARLAASSRPPTLAELSPYREALVVHEYQVTRVVQGSYDGPRLRVAHWAFLDGEPQPALGRAVGEVARLTLEPFARNRQLESVYLGDTLAEDFDLELWLAVEE